jgi:hypothetical protein
MPRHHRGRHLRPRHQLDAALRADSYGRHSRRPRAAYLSRRSPAWAALILIYALVLVGVLAGLPRATADGATFRFSPRADAYVSQARPTRNFGSDPTLRACACPNLRRSYLRFDVTRLAGTVTSATLRLYGKSTSQVGYSVRSVASAEWIEDQITFANAPTPGPVVARSGSINRGTWSSVDVTALVSGNRMISFVLTAESSSVVGVYASRETGATAPQLIVNVLTTTTTTMPTTTAAATTTMGATTTTAAATTTSTTPPAPAAAPTTTVPATGVGEIPSSYFGLHLMDDRHWPSVPFGVLGKGTAMTWPWIEGSRGNYYWGSLDAWVNLSQQHGKSIFMILSGVPKWAAADTSNCTTWQPYSCNSMVRDLKDYEDFITAVATRYKGKLIYELWNEPDTIYFTHMSYADFVKLTNAAHDIIRRIDPGAPILAPSGGASWLDGWWAAGGTRDIDAVTYHEYEELETIPNHVSRLKAVMAKYGLTGKPIWNTEGSWGSKDTAFVQQTPEPGFVARYYLVQWPHAKRVYWYAWENSRLGTLWDQTSGVHPAAIAYTQVYRWMVGATMDVPCAARSGSIWTCHFIRPSGYQALAVWNTSGNAYYTPPTEFRRYQDLSGNTVAITAGRAVPIGLQPILLETSAP